MSTLSKMVCVVNVSMYIGMIILPILGLIGVPGCLVASAIYSLVFMGYVLYYVFIRKVDAKLHDPVSGETIPEDK